MIIESVAAVTAACRALEMAAGAANNAESLGLFIGRLGAAEYDLQSAKLKKGRSAMSEVEAAQIVLAEEAARKMREKLYSVFLETNRLDLWKEIERKVFEARIERKKEIQRQAAERAQRLEAVKQVALIACLAIFLAPPAIYAAIQLLL